MRSLIVLRITSYYFEQRESAMNKVVEHITAKRHRSNAGRLAGRSESSLPSTAIAANTIFQRQKQKRQRTSETEADKNERE